jgi:hypothetical protein
MKESRKQFIREAYGAACGEWKRKIEQEFPELFENELKVGNWYKDIDSEEGKHLWYVTESNRGVSNPYRGYGFNGDGDWSDEDDRCFYGNYREASKDEVEKALIKGAKRRGLWDVPIKGVDGWDSSLGDLKAAYISKKNKLWSRYGLVFRNGRWAEIIEKKNSGVICFHNLF